MGYYFRDKDTKVWKIRWDDPPGPNGKRRQRTMSCRKLGNTREVAKAELARIETEINQHTYVTQSKTTVSDLIDRWLEDCAPEIHEATTIETEKYYIEAHIRPYMGGTPAQQVDPLFLQDFHKFLRRKQKLAPKTIRNIHGVLSGIFKQGVSWKVLSYNPAAGVVLPKREKPQKRAATPEEMGRILGAIERSKYRLPLLVIIETGMRRSEALCLRWEDLTEWNVDEKVFHGLFVRGSVGYTKELGVFPKRTKTSAGERPVMISAELATELREHHKRQIEKSSDPELSYRDRGWMFAADDGNLVRPRQLTRAFTGIVAKLEIQLCLHELRHTQVSVLADRGVNSLLISDRVGWADDKMMGVYGHTTVEMQEVAVNVISTFLAESREAAKQAANSNS